MSNKARVDASEGGKKLISIISQRNDWISGAVMRLQILLEKGKSFKGLERSSSGCEQIKHHRSDWAAPA